MKQQTIIIILILIALGASAWKFGWLVKDTGVEDDLVTVKLYDSEGNLVKPKSNLIFSIFEYGSKTYENVASMKMSVNVRNTGELPLAVSISDISSTFAQYFNRNLIQNINVGGTGIWESSIIDLKQFEGTTQNFSVSVKGIYTYGGVSREIVQSGGLIFTTYEDPTVGLSVDVTPYTNPILPPPQPEYVLNSITASPSPVPKSSSCATTFPYICFTVNANVRKNTVGDAALISELYLYDSTGKQWQFELPSSSCQTYIGWQYCGNRPFLRTDTVYGVRNTTITYNFDAGDVYNGIACGSVRTFFQLRTGSGNVVLTENTNNAFVIQC